MKEQNYSNHSRLVPLFHFGTLPLTLTIIGCSAISLYRHYSAGLGLMLPAIALLGGIVLLLLGYFARAFALIAQDRAIRAEENLRYFAITGNLLDSRLTNSQIIALRFAPNNELLDLAHLAAEKNLSSKEIKQAVKNWKGDHHRV
ncbi:MAG: DUF6526 family protein [Ferruginibacter sp.]